MKNGHRVSSSSAFLRATKESCFHRVVVGGEANRQFNLFHSHSRINETVERTIQSFG